MKFRVAFFVCVFACALTHCMRAQDVSVSILLDSLDMKGVSRQQLLYTDDSITVVLQVKAKKGYIVKYKNCCGEVKRVEMTDKVDTDRGVGNFSRAEQMGENIILFYNGMEPTSSFLYGQRLNMHTMMGTAEPELLAYDMPAWSIEMEFSPDRSKLLVHSGGETTGLSVIVYSADLELVWRKLNYTHGDRVGADNYAVNNNGDVAYYNIQEVSSAVLNRPSNKKIKCGVINWFTEYGTYTPYFFDDDFYMFERRMIFNAEDKPELIGYYRAKTGTEIGVFTAIASDKNVAQRNLYRFSDDFVTANMEEKEKKRYLERDRLFNFYLMQLRICDVIIGSDKAVYLVGEARDCSAQHKFSYSLSFGDAAPDKFSKMNSDIVAIKIDGDGKLVWTKRITRAFLMTENSGGLTSVVRCFEFSGCLAIVFNDHPANKILRSPTDELQVTRNAPGSIAGVVYVFDKEGQSSRTDFAGKDDKPFVFDTAKWSADAAGAVVFWNGTDRAEFIRLSERK